MSSIKFKIPKKLVKNIADRIKPENFIEISIRNTETSSWASTIFKKVYTIRINSQRHKAFVNDTLKIDNIKFIQDKSGIELPKLISQLTGQSVFFLDTLPINANDAIKCTLEEDLNAIKEARDPIIIINNINYLGGMNPHADKAESWVNFDQLYCLCKKLFPSSYLTIIDGNLICVSKDLENLVNSYWIETLEERFFEPDPIPRKRTLLERVISRSKKILKKKETKKEAVAYNIRESVWFENECRKFKESHKWLQEKKFKSIIDIGANVGQFGKKIRQYYPEAQLFSFEPIPFVCDELKLNFEGDKNFTAFNVGLGDAAGKTKFFLNLFSDSSSMLPIGELHKKNFPYTKDEIEIEVEVKRLDDCFDVNKIEQPYLVKIDVQGFEEQVINGGLNVIRNAEMVITESSYKELYKGQSLFDTLYEKLKAMDFEFVGNLEQMESAFNGEPLQGDAIFAKKNR